jgi:uncharacterized protein YraI
MSFKRNLLTFGVAVTALFGTVAAAVAAPAYATANVNVRSGPGTGYGVVDVLRAGDPVDIDYCRGSWCAISQRGPDGWVSASYLARDRDRGYYDDDDYFYIERPRARPYRDYRPYRPYRPYRGSSACISGPNASFCVSN